MAINDTYTGTTAIYGGMPTPVAGAAWTPAVGTFANLGTDTLLSVAPAGWPNSDIAGPYINWSTAVFAKDYCPGGAYLVYGSGHLSSGPEWAGIWAFRLDTLKMECANRPPAPFDINTPLNAYGESTDPATLGHPYVPHNYDGLVYQSAAMGGGPKGSLWRFFIPGSSIGNVVHRWDLSASIYTPPTRVINQIWTAGTPGGGGSYPMTAVDESRGGIWLLHNNGNGPLAFVKFSDLSVTYYNNVDFNAYSDHSLIYLPAPYDCLVSVGPSNYPGSNPLFEQYVCPLIGNTPQGFTKVALAGTPPDGGTNEYGDYHGTQCGGQWSTILGAIVSYQGAGQNAVYRAVPPSNLTGTWTWSKETLTGANGATPSRNTDGNPSNGTWSRFIEAPAQRCFIYCGSVFSPTQAWRLQGM
jgi:hypothetical protein